MVSSAYIRWRLTRRRKRGGVAPALTIALAITLLGCGGTSTPHANPTSTSAPTAATTSPSDTAPPATSDTSTTVDSPVGQQLWLTYVAAVNRYDQLIADPHGVSSDPRLRTYMTGQWYTEVVQQINLLRFKNEIVKGPDRVYGFTLLEVDGHSATFYACDSNDQNPYNARTGAPLPTSTPGTVTENLQVTEAKSSSGPWLVEQVAGNRGSACAA